MATSARHTVALLVVPRLLRDTLARALAVLDVDLVDRRAALERAEPVDVAIVSRSAAVDIPAWVVVRLPAETDGGVGSVTTRGVRRPVMLDDLAAVLDIVRTYC